MKVGIITNGFMGILLESFELSRRLEGEGHKVVHFCPWDVRELVEGNGFEYRQLTAVNLFSTSDHFSSYPFRGFWSRMRFFNSLSHEAAVEFLGMDSMEEELLSAKMDHYIIDLQLHEPVYICQKNDLNYSLFSQWFSMHASLGNPSLRTEIIPRKGSRISGMEVFLSWRFQLGKVWLRRRLNDLLYLDMRRRLLYRICEDYGIDRRELIKRTFPSCFLYSEKTIWSSTLKELEFDASIPSNHIHIGPLVYESRRDGAADISRDETLRAIKGRKKEDGARVIYCSVSSLFSGDKRFLRNVIQAVAEMPGWLLIIGLGGKIKTSELGERPENVFVFEWVPQLQVLSFADVSINHAGIHSVNECIHFGVPMLLYSGKKYDQDGTAARLHAYGCALRADKDKSSVADIRRDIERVMVDGSYREKLGELQSFYQDYRVRALTPLLK